MLASGPGGCDEPMACTDRGRSVGEQVHDRDVVDRQVPEDIHVVLEQAQVDAGRVDVVQPAELARMDEGADPLDRRVVDKRVVHHEDLSGRRGRPEQVLGVLRARCQRLLHEDVLACLEGRERQGIVRRDGGCQGDGADRRVGEHLGKAAGPLRAGILALAALEPRGVLVADHDPLKASVLREVSRELGPPVSVPYDGDCFHGQNVMPRSSGTILRSV